MNPPIHFAPVYPGEHSEPTLSYKFCSIVEDFWKHVPQEICNYTQKIARRRNKYSDLRRFDVRLVATTRPLNVVCTKSTLLDFVLAPSTSCENPKMLGEARTATQGIGVLDKYQCR